MSLIECRAQATAMAWWVFWSWYDKKLPGSGAEIRLRTLLERLVGLQDVAVGRTGGRRAAEQQSRLGAALLVLGVPKGRAGGGQESGEGSM